MGWREQLAEQEDKEKQATESKEPKLERQMMGENLTQTKEMHSASSLNPNMD